MFFVLAREILCTVTVLQLSCSTSCDATLKWHLLPLALAQKIKFTEHAQSSLDFQ